MLPCGPNGEQIGKKIHRTPAITTTFLRLPPGSFTNNPEFGTKELTETLEEKRQEGREQEQVCL